MRLQVYRTIILAIFFNLGEGFAEYLRANSDRLFKGFTIKVIQRWRNEMPKTVPLQKKQTWRNRSLSQTSRVENAIFGSIGIMPGLIGLKTLSLTFLHYVFGTALATNGSIIMMVCSRGRFVGSQKKKNASGLWTSGHEGTQPRILTAQTQRAPDKDKQRRRILMSWGDLKWSTEAPNGGATAREHNSGVKCEPRWNDKYEKHFSPP